MTRSAYIPEGVTPPEDFPTHDNSALSLFSRCPRLYQLSHLEKVAPLGRSAALDFGSLIHLGLEHYYKALKDGASLTEAATAGIMKMKDTEFIDPLDDYRTKHRALLTFADYVAHYEDDKQWTILMTEGPFEVTDENGFSWGGKMDLVVKWLGRYWIVDHKTTSRGGATFYDSFFPDPATVGYAWAASRLVGQPVTGVIINRILVHKERKKPELTFERRPFNYQPWHFSEWYAAQLDKMHDITRAHERGYFRPNWEACVGKYGRCAMYDLCRTAPQNRERVIAQDYTENTWDWREEG
jgi:hypothetical protein